MNHLFLVPLKRLFEVGSCASGLNELALRAAKRGSIMSRGVLPVNFLQVDSESCSPFGELCHRDGFPLAEKTLQPRIVQNCETTHIANRPFTFASGPDIAKIESLERIGGLLRSYRRAA